MKKQTIPWLFSVVVLSFSLVVSVVLGFTGYYFSVSYINSNSDIAVGDSVNIAVLPNQSNVIALTFDGAYLPNEVIPQVVQINAEKLNVDVRVRVKAKVFGHEKQGQMDFVTTGHFDKANDGYYYFDNVLRGGEKVTFCNYLVFPQAEEYLSQEKYILTIIVETVDVNLQNIWQSVE